MKIKNKYIMYIKTVCLLHIMLCFVCLPIGMAAVNPLEIANIKPAGTGNPAINPGHRIFRAYPGIEYNIRAAVIGGAYPYVFSLSSAPEGMTINSQTGEITWSNPQASAGPIILKVTDSEGTSVTTSWSITVTTSGFIFVDRSYSGTETGSINQPYNSIQDLLNLNGHASDIVYFRAGTYKLPTYHSNISTGMGCRLDYGGGKPHMWLAYPGETVTIDMDDHLIEDTSASLNPSYYFDGLTFTNMRDYGFRIASGNHYVTFRRCDFNNLVVTRTTNENMGFVFFTQVGNGYYNVFQDSKFHDYHGGAGIGSIYNKHKLLIEDCQIYNQYQDDKIYADALAIKTESTFVTIRHNRVVVSEGTILGSAMNGCLIRTSNLEVCYNYFWNQGTGTAHTFNNHSSTGVVYYYRNTCRGVMSFKYLNSCLDECGRAGRTLLNGPFYISNNVIINNTADVTYHYTCGDNPEQCLVLSNNLFGTPSMGIIDTNGNLTDKYKSYLGAQGWQIYSDNIPPLEPSGVKAIIAY